MICSGLQVRRDVDVGRARGTRSSSTWLTKRSWKIRLASTPSRPRALLEHEAIRLAVLLLDVRMRRAEHDVDGVRVTFEDRRQRVDHVLDPLVGREQAEREDHRTCPATPSCVLAGGAVERHARDPVRDEVDLLARARRAPRAADRAPCALMTTRRSESCASSSMTTRCCAGFGAREDRVQRRHDRHPQLAQQREHVAARLAAEDAVLVLHARATSTVFTFRKSAARRYDARSLSAISKRTRCG